MFLHHGLYLKSRYPNTGEEVTMFILFHEFWSDQFREHARLVTSLQ